jgi:hypothetical protein
LLGILLNKLGQMHTGTANLLVVQTGGELARFLDLDGFMQEIKIRVERKDPGFYANSPYKSPADFYKEFVHLCGLLITAGDYSKVWANKQAKPSLPDKVLKLVGSLMSESGTKN